jgi:hypothetical protein
MPLDALPDPFLRTILEQIAMLLLAACNGDLSTARKAAEAIVTAHDPKTEAELRFVARIICFSLQACGALAQAADPDMPLHRVLRLRTGAVSLSREAQKAERSLEKLREARRACLPEDQGVQPEPNPEPPSVETPAAPAGDNRKIAAYAKAHGLTWTQAMNQRNRERNLAARRTKEARRAETNSAPAFA